MTTTLDPLADMLAELDTCAPIKVAKYDKKHPPSLAAPHLLDSAKRFRKLYADASDIETEMKGIKKDFITAATPFQLDMSRRYNAHVTTVYVAGVAVQCDPPHHTTKISDPTRIRELSTLYGSDFAGSFRWIRLIPETPEIVACLKAAGLKYAMQIAPLKALHERRYEPSIYTLLSQTPEVKPNWKVLAKELSE